MIMWLLINTCIMPDHIHLIIFLLTEEDGRSQTAPTISRVMKQFKGSVTKQIGWSIWQKSFADRVIRNELGYQSAWRYIENNPRKPFEWSVSCKRPVTDHPLNLNQTKNRRGELCSPANFNQTSNCRGELCSPANYARQHTPIIHYPLTIGFGRLLLNDKSKTNNYFTRKYPNLYLVVGKKTTTIFLCKKLNFYSKVQGFSLIVHTSFIGFVV